MVVSYAMDSSPAGPRSARHGRWRVAWGATGSSDEGVARVNRFTNDALGRASRAEQPSQIFTFLGSSKLVRHVRCYPNSGQIVAVPRMTLSPEADIVRRI
jgi:hypothetical protein